MEYELVAQAVHDRLALLVSTIQPFGPKAAAMVAHDDIMQILANQHVVARHPPTKPVLEEALEIIHGQRQADYGPPEVSFGRIAALWTAYLGDGLTTPLGHHDVAMLMNLLKVSRAKNGIDTVGRPQRDSLVDAAGYMGCSDLMPRQGDHHDDH